MKIYIDGIETTVQGHETLLETCRRNGVAVPSLCYAEGARHKPSCMVCMVRNEADGQMMPSCSTFPTEGMRIDTCSDEVVKMRKLAIDLLLSDHRADCEAPCTISCPKRLDVGQMLYFYDKGDFRQAREIVASAFRLPVLGCDDCKAPCEKVCRRGTVDEPVPIRTIVKRIAAMGDIPVNGDPKRLAQISRTDFSSKIGVFSEAEKERIKRTVDSPSRCLHCACPARGGCSLRETATSMGIRSPRYKVRSSQPFKSPVNVTGSLVFDPAKCIRCGLCVYNTNDGFTFKGRGFEMQVILPEESRGNVPESIASLCPTGALSLER